MSSLTSLVLEFVDSWSDKRAAEKLRRQNVTFRLFALAIKTLGKRFLELPVGPQTHAFSMKVEKKEVWEQKRKFLENSIGKKAET